MSEELMNEDGTPINIPGDGVPGDDDRIDIPNPNDPDDPGYIDPNEFTGEDWNVYDNGIFLRSELKVLDIIHEFGRTTLKLESTISERLPLNYTVTVKLIVIRDGVETIEDHDFLFLARSKSSIKNIVFDDTYIDPIKITRKFWGNGNNHSFEDFDDDTYVKYGVKGFHFGMTSFNCVVRNVSYICTLETKLIHRIRWNSTPYSTIKVARILRFNTELPELSHYVVNYSYFDTNENKRVYGNLSHTGSPKTVNTYNEYIYELPMDEFSYQDIRFESIELKFNDGFDIEGEIDSPYVKGTCIPKSLLIPEYDENPYGGNIDHDDLEPFEILP